MSTGIFKLAYRNRIVAKRAIAALDRVLPRPLGRRLRRLTEILAFRFTPHYQGDTLPPIFHYWSERHVRPMLQARGYESPEDFYLKYVLAEAGRLPEPLHIVSLGTGACALEIGLAVTLRERGVDFRLTCVDINRGLLDAGRHAATAAGVGAAMRFKATDAGQALAALDVDADVIIANQIFHHLEDLEDTVAGIARCLASHGGGGRPAHVRHRRQERPPALAFGGPRRAGALERTAERQAFRSLHQQRANALSRREPRCVLE